MMGVKYIKSGFYQEKNDMIGNAVRSYVDARMTEGMDSEEFSEIKRNSEELLGNIMYESGFREEGENYVNLDKEFFDERGQFDEAKLADFQKLMVRHYGLQDVKWTFAGTTANLTQITKKAFEESNSDYADMLPVELKREYEKEEQEKHLSKDPNNFTLFLYPDGSISDKYSSQKAQVHFENLKDKSGFNWADGYTPDNEVKKEGWSAGFNEADEWEMLDLKESSVEVNESNTADPSAFFTDNYKVSDDLVTFITLPYVSDEAEAEEGVLERAESGAPAKKSAEKSPEELVKIIEKRYRTLVEKSGMNEEAFKTALKESGIEAESLKKALKPQAKRAASEGTGGAAELKSDMTGEAVDNSIVDSNIKEESLNVPVKAEEVKLEELLAESEIKEEKLQTFFDKSGIKEESFKELILEPVVAEDNLEKTERVEKPVKAGETILFDHNSRLKDGKEQKFYSVTGELYGVREVDKEASIEGIKHSLKRQGIEKLAALVVADTSEETINYYKENFSELITDETQFYTRSDSALEKRLTTMKEQVIEQEASEELISGFFELAEKGRRGEELYEGLIPSVKSSTYQVSLSIFESKDDLDTFLSLPQVKKGLDAEVVDYLETVNVPADKKESYSNSVQNILNNYDKVFKNVNIDKVGLLKAALDVVSGNDNKMAAELKVLGEKGLTELVKDNTKESAQTDTPSFKRVVKKSGNYYNLLDKAELDSWAEVELAKQGISPEMAEEIKRVVLSKKIPTAKAENFSKALQNSFDEFKSIAMSTGMRAVELVEAVNEIVILNDPLGQYRTKKVYFEKPLAGLIEESAQGNRNKVTRVKKDVYLQSKVSPLAKELDLLNDQDLNTFIASSFLTNSGLETAEIEETVDYLKSVTIPAHKSRDFTRGVMKVIESYKSELAESGLSPLKALKMVENRIKSASRPLTPELATVLAGDSLSSPQQRVDENLDSFVSEKKYEQFSLTEEQFVELVKEHKEAYQGLQNRYFKTIPVKYKEGEVSGQEQIEMEGVDLPPQLVYKTLHNSVKNLGFVYTKSGQGTPQIHFTEDGKSLSTLTQQKIKTVAAYNNRVEEEKKISYNSFPLVSSSPSNSYYNFDESEQDQNTGEQGGEQSSMEQQFYIPEAYRESGLAQYSSSFESGAGSGGGEMTFTGSSNYMKGTGQGQQAMARRLPGQQSNSKLSNFNMQNLSAEQKRLRRIEENYYKDKAMLQSQAANQQNNQVQQLARSESHSPGDESGNSNKGGAAAADDGNVINKMSEDIFEEMKTELGSEF